MLRLIFAGLLAIHGAIHALGFVKAFGLAEVQGLTQPIGTVGGVLWLVAGLAFVISAVLLLTVPSAWWVAAAPGTVLSVLVIASSFSDAKYGLILTAIILVPLVTSLAARLPFSFRAAYARERQRGRARLAHPTLVTEADLAGLPPAVRTYLSRVGVVGRPHVRDFEARFRGRMRMAPDAAWMPITVDQVSFFDEPTRVFHLEASRAGIPFDVLHLYTGPSARMRVRIASLFEIVDARGPKMDQSETVTMLNDLCFLAPAALIDAPIVWQALDDGRVKATFTNAGHTVSAILTFDAEGDLVDFVSDDRYLSSDGRTYRSLPWSTPSRDYRDFGGVRLAGFGEARWHEPTGAWTYGEFAIESIRYNVGLEAARVPGAQPNTRPGPDRTPTPPTSPGERLRRGVRAQAAVSSSSSSSCCSGGSRQARAPN